MDFPGLSGALLQAAVDARKKVVHRRAHAFGERAGLYALARIRRGFAQGFQADALVECGSLLREHGSDCRIALHSPLEHVLFLLNPLHHVFDDVLVLAAQAPKLGELLVDAGDSVGENRPHACGKRADFDLCG